MPIKLVKYLAATVVVLFGLLALFPEVATDLAVDAERAAAGLDYKTVVIGDETWHYLEGGPADAEVLLLVHGFGADKDNWTRFAKSLTEKYRVIAPDLPGFGESVWHPDWDYSLLPQRTRLKGFVQAIGLEQFHIAGNSMGGHLAALYTDRFPQEVTSLALIDNAGVIAPVENNFFRSLANGKNGLIVDSAEEYDALIAMVAFRKPFLPWPAKGVFAQRAVDHAESNRAIFASYKNDPNSSLEPVLADIDKPVLIVWGEFDRIIDLSSVDVMRPLLPQAKVSIMQDTGHIPMLERPSDTAQIYLEFLHESVLSCIRSPSYSCRR